MASICEAICGTGSFKCCLVYDHGDDYTSAFPRLPCLQHIPQDVPRCESSDDLYGHTAADRNVKDDAAAQNGWQIEWASARKLLSMHQHISPEVLCMNFPSIRYSADGNAGDAKQKKIWDVVDSNPMPPPLPSKLSLRTPGSSRQVVHHFLHRQPADPARAWIQFLASSRQKCFQCAIKRENGCSLPSPKFAGLSPGASEAYNDISKQTTFHLCCHPSK